MRLVRATSVRITVKSENVILMNDQLGTMFIYEESGRVKAWHMQNELGGIIDDERASSSRISDVLMGRHVGCWLPTRRLAGMRQLTITWLQRQAGGGEAGRNAASQVVGLTKHAGDDSIGEPSQFQPCIAMRLRSGRWQHSVGH